MTIACPRCEAETRVNGHYRQNVAPGTRRRYRSCPCCGLHFTTEEAPVDADGTPAVERGAAYEISRRYLRLGARGRHAVCSLIAALEETMRAEPPAGLAISRREARQ